MDETFAINLLRSLLASSYFQASLAASREMFGRGYLSLGIGEKAAVDQAVNANFWANYHSITKEFLEGPQSRQPIGFPLPAQSPTPGGGPESTTTP